MYRNFIGLTFLEPVLGKKSDVSSLNDFDFTFFGLALASDGADWLVLGSSTTLRGVTLATLGPVS